MAARRDRIHPRAVDIEFELLAHAILRGLLDLLHHALKSNATMSEPPLHFPSLRSFGRTKGRPLSQRQERLVDTLLPHLAVPDDGEIDIAGLFNTLPISPLPGE